MVVQHNMQAANANRMLNITTGQQSKSTEKLSSGYKINRAADDAAGLSISEKMRKQIKGLDRASTNAEDGVSAVQTAEGALTEVHSMLQRMNELAVQAANGTNSTSDREAIQNEISQLTTEIDRVAETTKFNETYLLRGSSGTKSIVLKGHDAGLKGTFVDGTTRAKFKVTLTAGTSVSIGGKVYNLVRSELGVKASDQKDAVANLQKQVSNFGTSGSAYQNGSKVTLDGTTYTLTLDPATKNINGGQDSRSVFVTGSGTQYEVAEVAAMIKDGTKVQFAQAGQVVMTTIARDHTLATNISAKKAVTLMRIALLQANNIGVGDSRLAVGQVGYGSSAKISGGIDTTNQKTSAIRWSTVQKNRDKGAFATSITFTIDKGHIYVENDLGFALHVGADADLTNKINVDVEVMNSANLGIKDLNVKDDSGIAATYAIDAIEDAITKVSAQRSALGAVQNRLEHTIANLDNVAENTTASESRIRDTDMADEMVTFSKNNILAQAGQSMLAQANQSNQGVLSLLG